jgi:hypothetical protein
MEGFSYSNPVRLTYSFGLLAFTAALSNQVKAPPRCNQGRVVDIHVRVTIIFTNVTTPAFVNVGTVATPAKYAQLSMAAAAAGVSWNLIDGGGGATLYNEATVIFSDINFARDGVTFIQFQVVPMTGGAPTGTGFLDIEMAWF